MKYRHFSHGQDNRDGISIGGASPLRINPYSAQTGRFPITRLPCADILFSGKSRRSPHVLVLIQLRMDELLQLPSVCIISLTMKHFIFNHKGGKIPHSFYCTNIACLIILTYLMISWFNQLQMIQEQSSIKSPELHILSFGFVCKDMARRDSSTSLKMTTIIFTGMVIFYLTCNS